MHRHISVSFLLENAIRTLSLAGVLESDGIAKRRLCWPWSWLAAHELRDAGLNFPSWRAAQWRAEMAATPGVEPIPHDGRVQLLDYTGERYLHDARTDEVVHLLDAPADASLHVAASGWSYLARPGMPSEWVADKLLPLLDRNGAVVVDTGEQASVQEEPLLRSWRAEKRLAKLECDVGGYGSKHAFVVGVFQRRRGGACIYWSLRSLWDLLGAGQRMKSEYKSWRSNRWQALCKFVSAQASVPKEPAS